MKKQKAVMRIDSYQNGKLLLSVSDFGVQSMLKWFVEFCQQKHGGFALCEFSPPYKKRTTDVGGQNRHIWGHIQQIANETGNDVDDIEDYIKERALKRGYPYKINKMTRAIKPVSMTEINTVEAGYLIDELHQLAAELCITLQEE